VIGLESPSGLAKNDGMKLDRALVEAAFVCDFVRVRELLKLGAPVDARDDDGRTPLFSAVLGGAVGLVGLLLEEGADPNARDNEGWTPLHFAAQEYLPEMARLLIAKGADPNARDNEGSTVLWRAVFSAAGRPEVAQLLLDKGAKADVDNDAGESAEALAERLGSTVLVKAN
jgi:ankyrin repeat protein